MIKKIISKSLFAFLLLLLSGVCFSQYGVKFVIREMPAKHSGDNFFIAGNSNYWNPGDEQAKFKIDPSGIHYFEVKLPPGNYEYKITRGTWNKVECLADGKAISNRMLDLKGDTLISISIQGWSDDLSAAQAAKKHSASFNVSMLDSSFNMPQLNTKRRIWIYLPADYRTGNKRYPVLYMHDGQNLFDEATSGFGEWGIDESLDSLFEKGIKECIVIGIDNSPAKRMNEYNPYSNDRFGKALGEQYIDFIVQTLKPFVDNNYRTLRDKKNTFIAGSSMGGLISFYAVVKYPGIFGGAGIFSPSFWITPSLKADIKKDVSKINSKLFFYAGGAESDSMVYDMRRIEKEISSLSKATITEIIDADAKHNEAAWRKYFPQFYLWLMNEHKK